MRDGPAAAARTTPDSGTAAPTRSYPDQNRSPGPQLAARSIPRLEIALGDGTRRRVLGRCREFLIGRDLDNDLRIDEPAVSRHHLLLRPSPQGWELINRSRNGILVDDQPTERHVLSGPVAVALGQHPAAPLVVITPLWSDKPAGELPTRRNARPTAATVSPSPPARDLQTTSL